MSVESAKAFFDKMKNDEDFQRKVTACKDHDERKKFVHGEGFDFTLDELKSITGELSDDALEAVVGGKWCDYHCNKWGPGQE
jgi:predicted ribosomally synthesized peptide with nif11-like leader